jgi:hypothetical protein
MEEEKSEIHPVQLSLDETKEERCDPAVIEPTKLDSQDFVSSWDNQTLAVRQLSKSVEDDDTYPKTSKKKRRKIICTVLWLHRERIPKKIFRINLPFSY